MEIFTYEDYLNTKRGVAEEEEEYIINTEKVHKRPPCGADVGKPGLHKPQQGKRITAEKKGPQDPAVGSIQTRKGDPAGCNHHGERGGDPEVGAA